MSELAKVFDAFPQVLLNVDVEKKPPLQELPQLQETIARIERELGDAGRVLVRYSGTESKVRVLVESENERNARRYAEELAAACQSCCR